MKKRLERERPEVRGIASAERSRLAKPEVAQFLSAVRFLLAVRFLPGTRSFGAWAILEPARAQRPLRSKFLQRIGHTLSVAMEQIRQLQRLPYPPGAVPVYVQTQEDIQLERRIGKHEQGRRHLPTGGKPTGRSFQAQTGSCFRFWHHATPPEMAGSVAGDVHNAAFALILQPVAVALDVDGVGVVQQTIENGAGDHVVLKDRSPFAIALVGCEDHGTPLITLADQLEEARGRGLFQRGSQFRPG